MKQDRDGVYIYAMSRERIAIESENEKGKTKKLKSQKSSRSENAPDWARLDMEGGRFAEQKMEVRGTGYIWKVALRVINRTCRVVEETRLDTVISGFPAILRRTCAIVVAARCLS
jgi:hypothetical protein